MLSGEAAGQQAQKKPASAGFFVPGNLHLCRRAKLNVFDTLERQRYTTQLDKVKFNIGESKLPKT